MRRVVGIVVASGLLAACSLDWSYPNGATAEDGGGVDAGSTPDATTSIPDASNLADVTLPPDASKPNGTCLETKDCAAGNVCVFSSYDCGAAKENGVCAPEAQCVAATVTSVYCGCDGNTYASSCEVFSKGTDLAKCKTLPTGNAGGGFVSCPSPELLIIDPSLERSRVYRCENAPAGACVTDGCTCAQKAYCNTTGGTCSGKTVTCAAK